MPAHLQPPAVPQKSVLGRCISQQSALLQPKRRYQRQRGRAVAGGPV